MPYTRQQLEKCEGAIVPDLLGSEVRLLFVGINPGLWTAATGIHFAHPSNRFYKALRAAGLIDRDIDIDPSAPAVPVPGASSERRTDRNHLLSRGIGITNLYPRATRTAAEIRNADLRAGGERLERLVEQVNPRVVAVAGITAYRAAFGRREALTGRQPEPLGPAELWVVPNPSGLNAHETVDSLAEWYRRAGNAAGLV